MLIRHNPTRMKKKVKNKKMKKKVVGIYSNYNDTMKPIVDY